MKIRKVNKPKGHNRYCGPAIISALTSCDTNTAAYHIRETSGVKSVKGTHGWQLWRVLNKAGITGVQLLNRYPKNAPTLAAWLKDTTKDRKAGKVFLIAAGCHWQLVEGRRYVCGVVGDICSIKDKRVKRRAKVTEVYELHAPKGIKKLTPYTPTSSYDGDFERLKRKAKSLGFTWEKEWGFETPTWYCTHHSNEVDLAVSGGDEHYAHGKDELKSKLREWVDTYEELYLVTASSK